MEAQDARSSVLVQFEPTGVWGFPAAPASRVAPDVLRASGCVAGVAGRVREFQLRHRVSFRVIDRGGREFLPLNEITLTRDIPFNDAQVLALLPKDRPVLLVANKAEGMQGGSQLAEFYELGLGEVLQDASMPPSNRAAQHAKRRGQDTAGKFMLESPGVHLRVSVFTPKAASLTSSQRR